MKTTEKDFNLFKKSFLAYQQMFGLIEYDIFFSHEPMDDAFANITMCHQTATVRLQSEESNFPFDINANAKREATHLLLHKLEALAHKRYVSEEEIIEEEEALVVKLTKLLPSLKGGK